ncbi:dihydrofolate reductase [Lactococcus nasutitermitis]|uniref:Dihydrofolate reductase n=1 Tax=Lactococcus nasutitermitis TaxID=1652957 RepID=A0ABV9JES7_9LACT|nr:dihydrofolate reductase [Lactococcus nasutitermitis]
MIYGIWAEDEHGIIGNQGRMPWYLPAEQAHFKQTTMNQAILMGRKTFEGMKKRVLPGRISIVLTRDKDYQAESDDVLVMNDVQEVLDWYYAQEKDLFITGGAEILQLFEKHLEILYRTVVHGQFTGDASFPITFDFNNFKLLSEIFHEKDEKNPYDFTIKKYQKINIKK